LGVTVLGAQQAMVAVTKALNLALVRVGLGHFKVNVAKASLLEGTNLSVAAVSFSYQKI
jgi:hypothetical protein